MGDGGRGWQPYKCLNIATNKLQSMSITQVELKQLFARCSKGRGRQGRGRASSRGSRVSRNKGMTRGIGRGGEGAAAA